MTVVGAIARPSLSPETIREVALAAEAAGLDELWLWEDSFWEGGIAMSAAVLGLTQRLRVGIGVLPFPLRNVALAAMEIAALERTFPDRFLVGLGHGVQDWMAQAGVRAASPLTLMREYVPALRALLAGERVTTTGDYVTLREVQLVWPSLAPTTIHLGATGPKSLAVSGEVGDGTILVSDTRLDDMPAILERIQAGRAAAGRAGSHQVTMFVETPLAPGPELVDLVRRWADAGADRVVLQPTAEEPDPVGFVELVAREVQPTFHAPPA